MVTVGTMRNASHDAVHRKNLGFTLLLCVQTLTYSVSDFQIAQKPRFFGFGLRGTRLDELG